MFGMPAEIKFSLGTKDWDEAVLRCQEENLKLERQWRASLVGRPPTQLSHLQICAHTGARVNEVTQLRACDVEDVEGIPCIRITPEAGTVKTAKKRTVPRHPHLIEMKFVEFAHRKKGPTPLFYSLKRQRNPKRNDPTYASVGNKLAAWVRGLGIKDPGGAPNHGRHRFKTEGRRTGMIWLILDSIQGHAPRTEGENYGEVPPKRHGASERNFQITASKNK